MLGILGYGLKCIGKAMKTPQAKGMLRSYALLKCSQKGLDPAMMDLYKDTINVAIKEGVKYTIYGIKNFIA